MRSMFDDLYEARWWGRCEARDRLMEEVLGKGQAPLSQVAQVARLFLDAMRHAQTFNVDAAIPSMRAVHELAAGASELRQRAELYLAELLMLTDRPEDEKEALDRLNRCTKSDLPEIRVDAFLDLVWLSMEGHEIEEGEAFVTQARELHPANRLQRARLEISEIAFGFMKAPQLATNGAFADATVAYNRTHARFHRAYVGGPLDPTTRTEQGVRLVAAHPFFGYATVSIADATLRLAAISVSMPDSGLLGYEDLLKFAEWLLGELDDWKRYYTLPRPENGSAPAKRVVGGNK